MTLREMAICELYTGICFLAGDKREYSYRYASELLGEEIWTHEFWTRAEELKELAKPDFLKLCANPTGGYNESTSD